MTETPRWLEFHDRVAWRAWLRWHHTLDGAVWVLINKKATPPPGLYYEEAVEEALCWGWIDSTLNA
ncbi:MAG: YdeI/OmpD-associated family protein, partial [Anaerolineae bacterium]